MNLAETLALSKGNGTWTSGHSFGTELALPELPPLSLICTFNELNLNTESLDVMQHCGRKLLLWGNQPASGQVIDYQ